MSERDVRIYTCDNCGEESEEEMGCIGHSMGTFDVCCEECSDELADKLTKKEKKISQRKPRVRK